MLELWSIEPSPTAKDPRRHALWLRGQLADVHAILRRFGSICGRPEKQRANADYNFRLYLHGADARVLASIQGLLGSLGAAGAELAAEASAAGPVSSLVPVAEPEFSREPPEPSPGGDAPEPSFAGAVAEEPAPEAAAPEPSSAGAIAEEPAPEAAAPEPMAEPEPAASAGDEASPWPAVESAAPATAQEPALESPSPSPWPAAEGSAGSAEPAETRPSGGEATEGSPLPWPAPETGQPPRSAPEEPAPLPWPMPAPAEAAAPSSPWPAAASAEPAPPAEPPAASPPTEEAPEPSRPARAPFSWELEPPSAAGGVVETPSPQAPPPQPAEVPPPVVEAPPPFAYIPAPAPDPPFPVRTDTPPPGPVYDPQGGAPGAAWAPPPSGFLGLPASFAPSGPPLAAPVAPASGAPALSPFPPAAAGGPPPQAAVPPGGYPPSGSAPYPGAGAAPYPYGAAPSPYPASGQPALPPGYPPAYGPGVPAPAVPGYPSPGLPGYGQAPTPYPGPAQPGYPAPQFPAGAGYPGGYGQSGPYPGAPAGYPSQAPPAQASPFAVAPPGPFQLSPPPGPFAAGLAAAAPQPGAPAAFPGGAEPASQAAAPAPEGSEPAAAEVSAPGADAPPADPAQAPLFGAVLPIHPGYTFETLQVGSFNRFSHAASMSVIANPGSMYNPLFLFGGPGVGKTHLLTAIARALQDQNAEEPVLLTTGPKLARAVALARKAGRFGELEAFAKGSRALLIDDIHVLDVNQETQESLASLLAAYLGSSRQVVMTSIYPPRALGPLEEALRFQISAGWSVDMKPLSAEVHKEILGPALSQAGFQPDPSTLDWVATKLEGSTFELGKWLGRLAALLNLRTFNRQPCSLQDLLPILFAADGAPGAAPPSEEMEAALAELGPAPSPDPRALPLARFFPQGRKAHAAFAVRELQTVLKQQNWPLAVQQVHAEEYDAEQLHGVPFAVGAACQRSGAKLALVLGPNPGSGLAAREAELMHAVDHLLAGVDVRLAWVAFVRVKEPAQYFRAGLDLYPAYHHGFTGKAWKPS
ncbi:MAG: ATP-binding protein [Elusimicrobia bacterium]|nr:ATP-binding protein [Elusimicrobiota bacterium]